MDVNIQKTGIIRYMDDIGRLVFPKEIRKEIQAYEMDAFELSVIEIDGKKSLMATPYFSCGAELTHYATRISQKLFGLLSKQECLGVYMTDAVQVYSNHEDALKVLPIDVIKDLHNKVLINKEPYLQKDDDKEIYIVPAITRDRYTISMIVCAKKISNDIKLALETCAAVISIMS